VVSPLYPQFPLRLLQCCSATERAKCAINGPEQLQQGAYPSGTSRFFLTDLGDSPDNA